MSLKKTMRAICLTGTGEASLKLCELPVPEPQANQVLCRVDAVTSCASDTKLVDQGPSHSLMYGWDTSKHPVVIGHECALTVAKPGKGLETRFPVGMRCALQPAIPSGPKHQQENYRDNANGIEKTAIGYTLGGAYAEYSLLTEEVIQTGCLMPLENSTLPHFSLCLAEPYSCVVAAQERNLHLIEGPEGVHPESGVLAEGIVVIIGAGPMGLMHVEVALTRQPAQVIVSEILEPRRAKAQAQFKNKPVTVVHPDDLKSTLDGASNKRGADDVIIAAGNARLQQASLDLLAKNGVANFFGGTKSGESEIIVDARRVHYDSISLVGTSGGEPRHVMHAVELLNNQSINASPYISTVGGLDAALDLLSQVRHQKLDGKGVIYPHLKKPLEIVSHWSAQTENNLLKA